MARNFGRIPTTPGGSWKGALGRGSGQKEAHVNRLGNLVLLPPELNSRIGNRDFSLKKTAYRETGLLLGDVFRKNKWNKQAIEAREKALLTFAVDARADSLRTMRQPKRRPCGLAGAMAAGGGWIQSWAAATGDAAKGKASCRLPDATSNRSAVY